MCKVLFLPFAVFGKAKVIQLFEADLDFELGNILLLFTFVLINIHLAPCGSRARSRPKQIALIQIIPFYNIIYDVKRVSNVNDSIFSELFLFLFISGVGFAVLIHDEFFG